MKKVITHTANAITSALFAFTSSSEEEKAILLDTAVNLIKALPKGMEALGDTFKNLAEEIQAEGAPSTESVKKNQEALSAIGLTSGFVEADNYWSINTIQDQMLARFIRQPK